MNKEPQGTWPSVDALLADAELHRKEYEGQWAPPEERCYLCGHNHGTMAHWSRSGETRALCHEADHSCYTRHNRQEALGEPLPAAQLPALGTVSIDVLPDLSNFLRKLKALGSAATRTQRAVNRMTVQVQRRKPLIHKGGKP